MSIDIFKSETKINPEKHIKTSNFFLISIHDKDDVPLILLKYIKGGCGIKSYDLGPGFIFSTRHMMQLHSFICLFFMLDNLVTSYLSFIRTITLYFGNIQNYKNK